ncbi:MAG: hypothetical protein GYB24_15675 [Rhodobacteraceae bacterium]|nr:hypothetical protein [Paracoccaceae bacterium]
MTALSFREAVEQTKEYLLSREIAKAIPMTREIQVQRMAQEVKRAIVGQDTLNFSDNLSIALPPPTLNLDGLIKDARRNPQAFDAVGLLTADFIEHGEEMPKELRDAAIARLKGQERPKREVNRRRGFIGDHWYRDFYIWNAFSDLVDKGMNPTRNDTSPPTSACDAVAQAMIELGERPNSYSGVSKVWISYEKQD